MEIILYTFVYAYVFNNLGKKKGCMDSDTRK